MSKQVVYLVIGADQSVRASKRPQIKRHEIAIKVNLTFPDTWGRVVPGREINIDVPDFTPTIEQQGEPS